MKSPSQTIPFIPQYSIRFCERQGRPQTNRNGKRSSLGTANGDQISKLKRALLSKTAAQLCSDSRFYWRIGGHFAASKLRSSAAASMLSQTTNVRTEMLFPGNAEHSALNGVFLGPNS